MHRVLLVDDSQTTRSYAMATLEAQGDMDVTVAKSGLEALKILPQGDFDLLISDVNMPDINGLELIRFARAHERYKETPIIMISTEGRDTDISRALALGANQFLVKPFSPESLVKAARDYLPELGDE